MKLLILPNPKGITLGSLSEFGKWCAGWDSNPQNPSFEDGTLFQLRRQHLFFRYNSAAVVTEFLAAGSFRADTIRFPWLAKLAACPAAARLLLFMVHGNLVCWYP